MTIAPCCLFLVVVDAAPCATRATRANENGRIHSSKLSELLLTYGMVFSIAPRNRCFAAVVQVKKERKGDATRSDAAAMLRQWRNEIGPENRVELRFEEDGCRSRMDSGGRPCLHGAACSRVCHPVSPIDVGTMPSTRRDAPNGLLGMLRTEGPFLRARRRHHVTTGCTPAARVLRTAGALRAADKRPTRPPARIMSSPNPPGHLPCLLSFKMAMLTLRRRPKNGDAALCGACGPLAAFHAECRDARKRDAAVGSPRA